jgi:hypothetical protein
VDAIRSGETPDEPQLFLEKEGSRGRSPHLARIYKMASDADKVARFAGSNHQDPGQRRNHGSFQDDIGLPLNRSGACRAQDDGLGGLRGFFGSSG